MTDNLMNISLTILPEMDPNRLSYKARNCEISLDVEDEDIKNNVLPIAISVVSASVLLCAIFLLVRYFTNENKWIKQLPIDFSGYRNWEKCENFYTKEIKPNGKDWEVFSEIWSKLYAEDVNIRSVECVINPTLAVSFVNYRELLTQKIKDNPTSFNSQNWRLNRNNTNLRSYTHEKYIELCNEFSEWRSDEKLPILACVHGTDYGIAQKICSTGFSTLASLDEGFYGKGIYFTTYTNYALPYSIKKNNPSIIISLGCFGNTYPVVESISDVNNFLGKPISPGFQSHFVLTDVRGQPIKQEHDGNEYNELVVGQEAQILPVYIVRVNKESSLTRQISLNRSETF